MDSIAVGLGLLVAGGVIIFVGWPWWGRKQGFVPHRKNAQAELKAENRSARAAQLEILAKKREAVLNALRDLDFDHTMGKVTAEDYGPLRQTLLVEAANIMAQMDSKRATPETNLDPRSGADGAAVHPARPVSNISCPACGRAARPGAHYCTACGTRLSLACPRCKQTVRSGDLFCSSCGTEVALALS